MNVEEYLIEYKELTLYMIERVKIDTSIEYLVEKRQKILDALSESSFSKDEIKSVGNSLGLASLESELIRTVTKEKIDVKRKIETLKRTSNANMKYKTIGYVPSIFNKKM